MSEPKELFTTDTPVTSKIFLDMVMPSGVFKMYDIRTVIMKGGPKLPRHLDISPEIATRMKRGHAFKINDGDETHYFMVRLRRTLKSGLVRIYPKNVKAKGPRK